MKKTILLSVFSFISIAAWCQWTTLNENFNVTCASGTGIPASWLEYTPAALMTIPQGEWTCTPMNGRGGTPGMQCTDTFGGTVHLDTSFLMTPLLDLSSYTGSIFLQFDTKTTNLHLAANLSIEKVVNSSNPDSAGNVNLTSALTPLFSNSDSSGWVTHVADLTAFKSSPFYVAFRFNSASTTGSIWFLDNVLLTTHNITLNVPNQNNDEVEMTILGPVTLNQLNFSYKTPAPGRYQLALTDLAGRQVYHEQMEVNANAGTYSITGLDLAPGMYFLKMGNENTSRVAKVIVR